MSLQSGLNAVQGSFNTPVPQPTCYFSARVTGPHDDAKPESRVFFTNNIKREYNNYSGWSSFINGHGVGMAMSALETAGVTNPTIATGKHRSSKPTNSVAIGPTGQKNMIAYDNLTFDKLTPNPVATSSAQSLGTDHHGTKIATFPNTQHLIHQDYPRVSLADQYNRIAAPGLTLFGAPRGPGDVANLGPLGSDFIKGQMEGSIMQQLTASGASEVTNELLSQQNAYNPYVSNGERAGPVARRGRNVNF